jgi:hypothetical protein
MPISALTIAGLIMLLAVRALSFAFCAITLAI